MSSHLLEQLHNCIDNEDNEHADENEIDDDDDDFGFCHRGCLCTYEQSLPWFADIGIGIDIGQSWSRKFTLIDCFLSVFSF